MSSKSVQPFLSECVTNIQISALVFPTIFGCVTPLTKFVMYPRLQIAIMVLTHILRLLQCTPEEVIWPQPKKIISHSNKFIQIHEAKIEIIFNETNPRIKSFLKKIVSLFMIKIKIKCPFDCSRNNSRYFQIALKCESSDLNLRWHTNESYSLRIRDTGLFFFLRKNRLKIWSQRGTPVMPLSPMSP